MKALVFSVITICLLAVGTTFLVLDKAESGNSAINSSKTAPRTEAHADWPVYNFDSMLKKLDLVALVSVDSIKEKPTDANQPSAKLVTVNVRHAFYGESLKQIVLDQAVEPLEKGHNYLIFLKKAGDYYYVVDKNSKIKDINGNFNVQIPGLKGQYTLDQFKSAISNKLK